MTFDFVSSVIRHTVHDQCQFIPTEPREKSWYKTQYVFICPVPGISVYCWLLFIVEYLSKIYCKLSFAMSGDREKSEEDAIVLTKPMCTSYNISNSHAVLMQSPSHVICDHEASTRWTKLFTQSHFSTPCFFAEHREHQVLQWVRRSCAHAEMRESAMSTLSPNLPACGRLYTPLNFISYCVR